MKIVIVEDEIRIREGIARLLHRLSPSYEVLGEAENGRDGLALIREKKPELVITDIRMPEMDGLEMLEEVYREKIPVRAIVLSAYSEFEYARQAIRLGVTEYLLKPIVFNDFAAALKNVSVQVREAGLIQPEQMGTLEQVFGGMLSGSIVADGELTAYVERKYRIRRDRAIALLCLYLGKHYEKNREAVKRRMKDLLLGNGEIRQVVLSIPQKKCLLYVFYDYRDLDRLERWLQYQVLNGLDRQSAAVGWVVAQGFQTLREAFASLEPYMDWNIALGEGVMISWPKITKVQTVPCTYPVELENRMKTALCTLEYNKPQKILEIFHASFQDGRVYAPREVKECYVRFLWAVIDTAKEVGRLDSGGLEQQRLLEAVMDARTGEELRAASALLMDRIGSLEAEQPEVSHLTVKRALSMIHEFYRSGITLEEIAAKLNITPEYLGTQFHQETGVNFSAYMKNFRMKKARELLIGTQLKLYEIAEQVGYSDPKYFSRVFKECVGQLPLDYRKTHK